MFCQMERDISVRPTEISRPVKVDHLQKWSQILWSDRTEMVRSIWFLTEISGILGWMESAPCFVKIEGNRFGQFLNTGYLKDQSELVKRGKPRVSKSHLIGWENEAMSFWPII